MIKSEAIVRYVRRDVPICPHHGPDHRQTMRQYSQRGKVRYYRCRQLGCTFHAKTVVVVISERVKG